MTNTIDSSSRYYVAGIDAFEHVLEELDRQLYSFDPRTHERALALFAIIEWCVVNGRAIPPRVGMDLMNAYENFMSLDKDATTLDAALGLRRPTKGARAAAALDFSSGLSTAAAVVVAVEQRKAADESIDDALFNAVGAALGRPISGGSAKAIYYANHDRPAVFLELRAHKKREAKEAIEAAENQEAAVRLRERLGSRDGGNKQ